jgi:hypothetical protein
MPRCSRSLIRCLIRLCQRDYGLPGGVLGGGEGDRLRLSVPESVVGWWRVGRWQGVVEDCSVLGADPLVSRDVAMEFVRYGRRRGPRARRTRSRSRSLHARGNHLVVTSRDTRRCNRALTPSSEPNGTPVRAGALSVGGPLMTKVSTGRARRRWSSTAIPTASGLSGTIATWVSNQRPLIR